MMIKGNTSGQITTKFFQMCYEADPPVRGFDRLHGVYDPAPQEHLEQKRSVWTLTLANQGRVRAVFKTVS